MPGSADGAGGEKEENKDVQVQPASGVGRKGNRGSDQTDMVS